jgi:hypothetical protein
MIKPSPSSEQQDQAKETADFEQVTWQVIKKP